MKSLEIFDINTWETPFSKEVQDQATLALESGKVLYFPHLAFNLNDQEKQFLTPDNIDPKTKNISYNIHNNSLSGALYKEEQSLLLKEMIRRFATNARTFLTRIIPHYTPNLLQARTSYRPVEISGRKTSYRKDDTRLHVDSFPSSPTRGQRILRVFSNINPHGKPRVWRLGEPFEDVVDKMAPRASRPIIGLPHLLKLLKITKGLRTPYDHYMLQMHDKMKEDMSYQNTVPQEEIQFPSGSSWIVYTDQVSHAAMSGQYVLEQTFHLPSYGNKHKEKTPLAVLESYFKKKLV